MTTSPGVGAQSPAILCGGRIRPMVLGRHGAVGGSVLAAPPTPHHLPWCCPFPGKGEIPFLWEFPLSWQGVPAPAPHGSLLTSCIPRVEVSFPEPALGGWTVPRDPLPSPGDSRPGQGDPLPKEATQGSAGPWGCPRGVLALHAGWPGPSHASMHMPLVGKGDEAPTTGTGWELTSKSRLA